MEQHVETTEYEYRQAVLSIKDAFKIGDIRWYHVPPVIPVGTKILNYIASHVLLGNTMPERVKNFFDMYCRCCNIMIGNELFNLYDELNKASFSCLDTYGHFSSDKLGNITYTCPLSSLYQKNEYDVTYFVSDLEGFFNKYQIVDTPITTETLKYDNEDFNYTGSCWVNQKNNQGLLGYILSKLDFSGFGLIVFTYDLEYTVGNQSLHLILKVIPDDQFNAKYLLKRFIKYKRFNPFNRATISDFNEIKFYVTRPLLLEEDLRSLFKAMYFMDFGKTVKCIKENGLSFYWTDTEWIDSTGLRLIEDIDTSGAIDIYLTVSEMTFKISFDFSELPSESDPDNEDNPERPETTEIYIDQLMTQMGITCKDRYMFVFILTNIMTSLYYQLHITYPEFFVNKEINFENNKTYVIPEATINDSLWFNLK